MAPRIIPYRLYRLRRLVVLSILPPVLVVCAIAALKGASAFVLLTLAIGLPVAHLLRYPTAWTETVAVSLVTAVLLALAGTIGPDVGLGGLALRLGGLTMLGAVLMLIAVSVLPTWLLGGETRPHTSRTHGYSRLSPEELKAAITLYPGRNDARVTCGPPDEGGDFSVTIHHRMDVSCAAEAQPFEVELFAHVLESTPTYHEVMCIEAEPDLPGVAEIELDLTGEPGLDDIDAEDVDAEALRARIEELVADATAEVEAEAQEENPPPVTVSRHEFTPTGRGGTRVDLAETGGVMSRGMSFGFWVQDALADHLTDEIDRAEGRPARANRSTSQSQLIVDIARLFMGSDAPVHPAQ